MATSSAELPGPSTNEEEGRAEAPLSPDAKGDGKKRKFKPLEAMRKLFKSGRKRSKSKDDQQVSTISVKAKSTTALQTTGNLDEDDDDDDGGFKGRTLGGARSISEDSVFSPEQRDPSLGVLKTVAVSEENIKSALKNELFTKLKKRNSQYSDEDDGLPHSPIPLPVTTADVIMGGLLKPLPGKSSSRESDKSLISMDSSENEDDDFFTSSWKTSAPPKPKKTNKSSPKAEAPVDFGVVKSTQSLNVEAAKHKISVKPKARRNRQSRKKKEGPSTTALPSLNEESPTKIQATESAFSLTSVDISQTDISSSSEILEVTTRPGSGDKPQIKLKPVPQAAKTSPKPPVKPEPEKKIVIEVKTEQPSMTAGSSAVAGVVKDHDVSVKSASAKQNEKPEPSTQAAASGESSSEFSQAFNKIKRRSVKMDTDDVQAKSAEKEDVVKPTSNTGTTVSNKAMDVKVEVKKSSDFPISSIAQASKDLDQSLSSSVGAGTGEDKQSIAKKPLVETDKNKVVSVSADEKQPLVKKLSVESQKGVDTSDSKSEKNSINSDSFKKDSLKTTDSGNKAPSPKEEYKLRRQARSKTLPEQPVWKDEQYTAKVQRANSQRVDSSHSSGLSMLAAASSPQRQSVVYTATPAVKKNEPKRRSWVDSSPTTATATTAQEPEWMAMVRKRKVETDATESESASPAKPQGFPEIKPKEVLITSVAKEADSQGRKNSVPQKTDSTKNTSPVHTQAESSKPLLAKTESVKTGPSRVDSVQEQAGKLEPVKPLAARPGSVKVASSRAENVKPSTRANSVKASATKTDSASLKLSPTEEAKKVFSKDDSTKVAPTRSGNVNIVIETAKSTSSSSASVGAVSRGSVQSKQPASEKSQSSQAIPAWRSNLQKTKEPTISPVKIEIIEKQEPKVEVTRKKNPVVPSNESTVEKCRDTASNRSSKVLDMVKNFQKLQVS